MSLHRAYRKAAKAFQKEDGRDTCPYPDHRKLNDPKRPLPMRREWLRGYDEASLTPPASYPDGEGRCDD